MNFEPCVEKNVEFSFDLSALGLPSAAECARSKSVLFKSGKKTIDPKEAYSKQKGVLLKISTILKEFSTKIDGQPKIDKDEDEQKALLESMIKSLSGISPLLRNCLQAEIDTLAKKSLLPSSKNAFVEGDSKRMAEGEVDGKSSEELEKLLKEIDLIQFSSGPDLEQIREAVLLAIKCNRFEVIEAFISKGFEINDIKNAPIKSVTGSGDALAKAGLFDCFACATPSTLKKLMATAFTMHGMTQKIEFDCCATALKHEDTDCFEALVKAGVDVHDEGTIGRSIFFHLLLNHMKMAEKLFALCNLEPNPRKPYFLRAIEMERFDVARLIALKDENCKNDPWIKTGLLPYVKEGDEKIVRFCVEECGIETRCLINEFRETIENEEGESPAKIHVSLHCDEANSLLLQAMKHGHQSLIPILQLDESNVTTTLFAHHLSILPEMGNIAHSYFKSSEITNQLLSLGARIDVEIDGETILCHCVHAMIQNAHRAFPHKKRKHELQEYLIFLLTKGANLAYPDALFKESERSIFQTMLNESEAVFSNQLIIDISRFMYKENAPDYREEPFLKALYGSMFVHRLTAFKMMNFNFNRLLCKALIGECVPISKHIYEELLYLGANPNKAICESSDLSIPARPLFLAALHSNKEHSVDLLLTHPLSPKIDFTVRDSQGRSFFAYIIPFLSRTVFPEAIDFDSRESPIRRALHPQLLPYFTRYLSQAVSNDIFIGICYCYQADHPESIADVRYAIDLVKHLGVKFDNSEMENYFKWKNYLPATSFLMGSLLLSYRAPSLYRKEDLQPIHTEGETKEIAEINCARELENIPARLDLSKYQIVHPHGSQPSLTMTPEQLLKYYHELVVNRIKLRPAYVGTPKKYENAEAERNNKIRPEFNKFYEDLEDIIKHFLHLQAKSPLEDKDGIAFQTLLSIFEACGAQWSGGIGELCIAMGSVSSDIESAVRSFFTNSRNKLFKNYITLQMNHYRRPNLEVHLRNYLVETIGLKLGIPGSEKMKEGLFFLQALPIEAIQKGLLDHFEAYSSPNIYHDFQEMLSGEVNPHLLNKEHIVEAMKHKLIGEWNLKEYMERAHQIKEQLQKFFLEGKEIPSMEKMWPFLKRSAERCEIIDKKIVTLDDKIPILIDTIKTRLAAILKNKEMLSKEEILMKIRERVDFATELSRREDFILQIVDSNGNIFPHMILRYLHALNLLERRVDLVNWTS